MRLRVAGPADEGFLFRLYTDTRRPDLEQTGWSVAEQDAFLRMQFDLASRAYVMQFPGAETRIVLDGETPVGRMLVARRTYELRLVDITLLPEARRKGLGTCLLTSLQADAHSAGLPLKLQVLKTNPALRLYERLGFRIIGESSTHFAMEWQ